MPNGQNMEDLQHLFYLWLPRLLFGSQLLSPPPVRRSPVTQVFSGRPESPRWLFSGNAVSIAAVTSIPSMARVLQLTIRPCAQVTPVVPSAKPQSGSTTRRAWHVRPTQCPNVRVAVGTTCGIVTPRTQTGSPASSATNPQYPYPHRTRGGGIRGFTPTRENCTSKFHVRTRP